MDESPFDFLGDSLLGSLEDFCRETKGELVRETVPEKQIEYGEEMSDTKDVLELKIMKQECLDVEKLCKYCNFSAPKQALMKHMRTHMVNEEVQMQLVLQKL